MDFLSRLLNGALGQHPALEFERIPLDEEVFPKDGIVHAPEFINETPAPSAGLYLGPQVNFS